VNTIKPSCGIGQAGNATVEAGVTISLLLLLILGTVQLGQTLTAYNTMLFVIEEAGRYAMVHNHELPDACANQRQAPSCPVPSDTALANCAAGLAQQLLFLYQGSNIDISATEDRTSSPPRLTICASYPIDSVVPQLLRSSPLTLARQVTVPLI
jgi:hypothetical protein